MYARHAHKNIFPRYSKRESKNNLFQALRAPAIHIFMLTAAFPHNFPTMQIVFTLRIQLIMRTIMMMDRPRVMPL